MQAFESQGPDSVSGAEEVPGLVPSVGVGQVAAAVVLDAEEPSVEIGCKGKQAVASVGEEHNVDIGIRPSVEDRIGQCGVAAVGFAPLVLRWDLSPYKSFHRNDEVL